MSGLHVLRNRLVEAPGSLGERKRVQRWEWFEATFPGIGSMSVIDLGGTVAAEHGLGTLKLHRIGDQLGPQLLALQSELKRVFDPKGLLNPGKKVVVS